MPGEIEFEGVQRAIRPPKAGAAPGDHHHQPGADAGPDAQRRRKHLPRPPPARRFGRIDWPLLSRDAQRVLGELERRTSTSVRASVSSASSSSRRSRSRAPSPPSPAPDPRRGDQLALRGCDPAPARSRRPVAPEGRRGPDDHPPAARALRALLGRATVLRDGHLDRHRAAAGDDGKTTGPDDGRPRSSTTTTTSARSRRASRCSSSTRCAPEDGVLQPVSLKVRRGEIVGVAGLVGSGKAELGLVLGGAVNSHGTAKVAGEAVKLGDPAQGDLRRHRLRPRRPQTRRPAADPQCRRELLAPWPRKLTAHRRDQPRLRESAVGKAIDRYGVVIASASSRHHALRRQPAEGGAGPDLLARLHVLVLSEPTRGVDVGAKSEIYDLIQAACGQRRGDRADLFRAPGAPRPLRPDRCLLPRRDPSGVRRPRPR